MCKARSLRVISPQEFACRHVETQYRSSAKGEFRSVSNASEYNAQRMKLVRVVLLSQRTGDSVRKCGARIEPVGCQIVAVAVQIEPPPGQDARSTFPNSDRPDRPTPCASRSAASLSSRAVQAALPRAEGSARNTDWHAAKFSTTLVSHSPTVVGARNQIETSHEPHSSRFHGPVKQV